MALWSVTPSHIRAAATQLSRCLYRAKTAVAHVNLTAESCSSVGHAIPGHSCWPCAGCTRWRSGQRLQLCLGHSPAPGTGLWPRAKRPAGRWSWLLAAPSLLQHRRREPDPAVCRTVSQGAALRCGQRLVHGAAAPYMQAASVCSVRLLLPQPCTAAGPAARVRGSPPHGACAGAPPTTEYQEGSGRSC